MSLYRHPQLPSDGVCPTCLQQALRMSSHMPHATYDPVYLSSQSLASLAPIPEVEIEIEWQCPKCATTWETVELYGQPLTRCLTRWRRSLPPPPLPLYVDPNAPPNTMFAAYAASAAVPGAGPPAYLARLRRLLELDNALDDVATEKPAPGPSLRLHEGGFIGYRAWKIRNWMLSGTGMRRGDWLPGVNEAVCMPHRGHDAPAENCECGMYGLARFDDQTRWWRDADVLGAIEAWSDVDENNLDRFFVHETGFRAQYALIVLLATDESYPRAKNAAIRSFAAEYGADVCRREHLEDAAKEHGQLIPDDWLDWSRDSWKPSLKATNRKFPKIKATIGTPGPPDFGKFNEGDQVVDSRAEVWLCVKSGDPGSWRATGALAP